MGFLKSSDEILSVGEFSSRFKMLLATSIPDLWIRGEVSGVKLYPSGHTYFSLKDENAVLSAVLFKNARRGVSVELKEGMKILAYGAISLYEARGSCQMIVKAVMPDGFGDLAMRFEELKKKLAKEGLFDAENKKKMPFLPRKIGIITSPAGAAVRDFISILRRRGWKGEIIVLPSRVQGAEAAMEIVSQIKKAESLDLDLLVLARGGGSLEDLWCFNEEIVARAVAACKIPTISAVGHEVDFSLCDFASDLRAETPSGAAEYISSEFNLALENFANLKNAVSEAVKNILVKAREKLESSQILFRASSPQNKLNNLSISLDETESRLRSLCLENIAEKKHSLSQIYAQFKGLSPLGTIAVLGEKVEACEKQLELLSVDSVLSRGFAIALDGDGRIIKQAKAAPKDAAFTLRFNDGQIGVIQTCKARKP